MLANLRVFKAASQEHAWPCAQSSASTYTASGRSPPKPFFLAEGLRQPSRRSIRSFTCAAGADVKCAIKKPNVWYGANGIHEAAHRQIEIAAEVKVELRRC